MEHETMTNAVRHGTEVEIDFGLARDRQSVVAQVTEPLTTICHVGEDGLRCESLRCSVLYINLAYC